MSTSSKKVAANRINGQKSHGPIHTTSTRFNATKHGLLAMGITELDDVEGYRSILNDLRQEKTPVGIQETLLVDSIALDIVRLRRARRLEAEYITAVLNPPIHGPRLFGDDILVEGQMLDPGLPAPISAERGQFLVSCYQRYESIFANRISRSFLELERLQRMRNGERLPAPTFVDVSVHTSTPGSPAASENSTAIRKLDSAPAVPEQPNSVHGEEDNVVPAESGTLDSVPEAFEQAQNRSGDLGENVHGTGIANSLPEALEEPKAVGDEEATRMRNEPK